jgi:septal ring factor EnvC (AmiA/AmiB activator)
LTIDAGKSQEECDKDLETMQQRIAKVAKKREWIEVQKATPALEQKRDALRAELNAVFERINPQLVKLEWDLHAASDAAAQCLYIDDFLNTTCLNQGLLEREREVGEHRKELGLQKRTLEKDLTAAEQHLSYFNARLKRKESLTVHKELEAQRDEWQSTIEQLERAIELVDERLLPIDEEIADIQREKLLP